jgi:hypothetical protein
VSSRTARAIQRNPVLKKQTNKQTKKQKKTKRKKKKVQVYSKSYKVLAIKNRNTK